jgi:hypothetical protein
MTRSKLVTEVASWLFLCAMLLYLWRPEYYQIAIAAGVLSIAASIYAAIRATPADVERVRNDAWLVPVATVLFGAYFVYRAAPEDRGGAWLAAGGLVVLGFVMYALRRRVT